MITVAYVFPNGELGGAEIATARILRAHDRTEVEPVGLLLAPGPLEDVLAAAAVRVEWAPFRPRLRSGSARRAARRWIVDALRRHGAKVQHSVMAWTHALAGRAARRAGAAPVWYQHTPPMLSSAIDWWAGLSPTRLVIANSPYTARLQRTFNLRRAPIEVIPPPIGDLRTQYPVETVRRTLGAVRDDVLAVLPARLQRIKGHEVAIRALAAVAADAPALKLVIAGDAAFGLDAGFKEDLQALATSLGVADRVRFTGFQRRMADLYHAADIVLQPSTRPEGYGLVTAEAQAAGRAVIASRIGALPDLVTHGVNGFLVKPGDVASLADALRRLAVDEVLRGQMASLAAQGPHSTAEWAARRLEMLYRRVVRR